MSSHIAVIEILSVPVARLDRDAALGEVERLYEATGPSIIVYANAHALNLAASDPAYREVLRASDLVLGDGSGLAIAARFQGKRFPANLNGTDFNPLILGLAARKRWTVFLLGGRPGVAERAAVQLRTRVPGLEIVGSRDGYFADDGEVVENVRGSRAGLLMVAMGNPRQEKWLHAHLGSTGARLGVGVGAFFDFAAGEVPRAPVWMRRAGIEWLWRLGHEPGRMWRRYLLGNPLFLWRALRERVTSGRKADR